MSHDPTPARSSRRSRALRRMAANGASAVRDPWVLLTSALGAGVGWAVNLPAVAAAGVGAAMLATAGVAKALTTEGSDYVDNAPPPQMRRGTPQARLVERLADAADALGDMVPVFAGSQLGSSVVEAATGARSSVDSARRLAAAIDAIDGALAGMSSLTGAEAGSSAAAERVRREGAAAGDRLRRRREELLGRIESAYLGAEEVRVRLLEVSAALQAPSLDPAADSGLAAVSENLEHLRRGLEELESTAARQRLPGEPEPPAARR
jgi:hypothetical protein